MKYVIAYVTAAFFTFAYIQEVHAPARLASKQWDAADAVGFPVAGGILWPIYWGGTIALGTVRYVKAHPGLCN